MLNRRSDMADKQLLQTNKQTNKQTNYPTNKQTNKQTNNPHLSIDYQLLWNNIPLLSINQPDPGNVFLTCTMGIEGLYRVACLTTRRTVVLRRLKIMFHRPGSIITCWKWYLRRLELLFFFVQVQRGHSFKRLKKRSKTRTYVSVDAGVLCFELSFNSVQVSITFAVFTKFL